MNWRREILTSLWGKGLDPGPKNGATSLIPGRRKALNVLLSTVPRELIVGPERILRA